MSRIVENIKDRGRLHFLVGEYIEKYFDGDIFDRPLILVVQNQGNDGFSVGDMDVCNSDCPLRENFNEEAYDSGYQAASDQYEDTIYNLKQDHEEVVDDLKSELQDTKDSWNDQVNELNKEIEALKDEIERYEEDSRE
jgi:uncharacterized protein YukE